MSIGAVAGYMVWVGHVDDVRAQRREARRQKSVQAQEPRGAEAREPEVPSVEKPVEHKKSKSNETTQRAATAPSETAHDKYAVLGEAAKAIDGKRELAEFEIDVYGPLPFPETVAKLIDDEIALMLRHQHEDGSFRFFGGRTTAAGGTVGKVTQTSLCGYSLREHVEVDAERIEPAIARALDYVLYMVRSGNVLPLREVSACQRHRRSRLADRIRLPKEGVIDLLSRAGRTRHAQTPVSPEGHGRTPRLAGSDDEVQCLTVRRGVRIA